MGQDAREREETGERERDYGLEKGDGGGYGFRRLWKVREGYGR